MLPSSRSNEWKHSESKQVQSQRAHLHGWCHTPPGPRHHSSTRQMTLFHLTRASRAGRRHRSHRQQRFHRHKQNKTTRQRQTDRSKYNNLEGEEVLPRHPECFSQLDFTQIETEHMKHQHREIGWRRLVGFTDSLPSTIHFHKSYLKSPSMN